MITSILRRHLIIIVWSPLLLFQILENLFPCSIITPLDCFWEGSKLLGPEYPVHIP